LTSSSVLDLALLVLVLLQLASGWRDGFLVTTLGLLGLVSGAVVAVLVLPLLAGFLGSTGAQALVVVLGTLVLAMVGRLGGAVLGARLRGRDPSPAARGLGAATGGLVGALAVLVLAWSVAGALRVAPFPSLVSAVSSSSLLRAVDDALPSQAGSTMASFWAATSGDALPGAFSAFGREEIANVEAPAPLTPSPGLEATRMSTVKVTGTAEVCSKDLSGSGFVLERTPTSALVVTNAHVVAGLERPQVRAGGEGEAFAASVVAFDPVADLALLDVPGLTAEPLVRGDGLVPAEDAVVAGFPLDGPYTLVGARAREALTAQGRDVYGKGVAVRDVYSLNTSVQHGNSGGPVLSPQGLLEGVVFARSYDDPSTAYALTLKELDGFLAAPRDGAAEAAAAECAR
jgi:S1-C subfamily serine protease